MTVKNFIQNVKNAVKKYDWIRETEYFSEGKIAKIRLRLKTGIIDIYFNEETRSISYAYIVKGRRIFGANNMKIGWHLHLYKKADIHRKTEEVSIERFLGLLEKELKKEIRG